mgnify:FL=1
MLLFLMRRRDGGQKAKKFMVYLMGIVMIGSLFGVVFFGFGTASADSIKYKDFRFANKGNFWSTIVNDREALFTYLPTDVELIDADDDVINRLRGLVQIDITSDYNDTFKEPIALAQFQMGVTLNNFNVFVRKGFTDENENNFPIIKCGYSTSFVPVIYFKSSNATRVYFQSDCIIAEASNPADVVRIKDRLVYGVLGII